jgi:hypothetical protein
MKDLLKELGAHARQRGFKGAGQTFRKLEDDFVFVFNIQKSRSGDSFFINLGAQPLFIPAACDADLSTLKEYECIMRERVGEEWSSALDEPARRELMRQIDAAQDAFFGAVRTLRSAIASDSIDTLLRKFTRGTTAARGALHLARAAAFLGHASTANALVERGLEMAGQGATYLIQDLKAVESGKT